MKSNYRIDNQCIAEITVKRNSIKKYQNDYYLKNGQEFEILLRNNTQDVVLATIKLNGKLISNSGIVLEPGRRVYLERYLDQNSKFIFETYKVDNSTESLRAIENNGNIEIQFYKEKQIQPIYYFPQPTVTYTPNYRGCYFNSTIGSNSTSIGYSPLMNCNITTSSNTYDLNVSKSLKSKVSLDEVETGRVGKGSTSNQSFQNYNGEFETSAFKIVRLKILPFSLKPLEVRDLVEYCVFCGTKNRKGNYHFCPKCGKKY